MTSASHGREGSRGLFGLSERGLSRLHLAMVFALAAILLANAFQSSVWYDETYSVAIAWHPFDEIWAIGADDVHPVVYYFFIHVLYLVFGTNVIAYRIFSVAGMFVLSLLGWTHVRKDVDARTGFLYSLFVYCLPWSVRIAFQVRMYAWLAVAIMLAAIYAWRIVSAAKSGAPGGAVKIRMWWWVALFLSSILAAYLHYYGAICAFVIQAIVIVSLVAHKAGGRNVAVWLCGAAVAVCSYLPWLAAAFGQASSISNNGYWIEFAFMGTPAELLLFPFNPPELEHLSYKGFGYVFFVSLLCVATVAALIVCLFSYAKAKGAEQASGAEPEKGLVLRNPATFCLAIMVLTVATVALASLVVGTAVLYYRYLTVFIGPLAVAVAYVVLRTDSVRATALACLLVAACGTATYYSVFEASHHPGNENVLAIYERFCDETSQFNGGGDPLVIGTTVYTDGILAVSGRGAPITYIPEWDNPAFRCYEPRFIMGETYETALQGFKGSFLFLGGHDAAEELAKRFGGEVVQYENAFHEYAGRWFDFSIITIR